MSLIEKWRLEVDLRDDGVAGGGCNSEDSVVLVIIVGESILHLNVKLLWMHWINYCDVGLALSLF